MHFNGDVCRLELVGFFLYAKNSFRKAAQWLSALSVVSEACSRMSVFNAAPPSLDDRSSLINLAGDTLQVPVSTKNAKALFLQQDLGY